MKTNRRRELKAVPVEGDPSNPLLSILIFNYDGRHLGTCLERIFQQSELTNFEIVLVDDASCDGAWATAVEFVRRYPARMTVQRNRVPLGPHGSLHKALEMARGQFCTLLTGDQAFRPSYVKRCMARMASDPYAGFSGVYRVDKPNLALAPPLPGPFPRITGKPLVSVLCYNFNYGRYLRECLSSVFSQTYENIELCFSDNASTDESWEIAVEIAERYPGKVWLTRNRANLGTDANFLNCFRNKQGEYYVTLCSDDALEPAYVERCVEIFEANPQVGMVIVNRAVIDEQGRRTEEPPFYNQSCIIPGKKQAAVYMMAGVNPSISQVMYRSTVVDKRSVTGGLVTRYYGTRILDFNISLDYDVGYIKDPLLLNREHGETDTRRADASLLPVLGVYVLNHQLFETASCRNLPAVTERLPRSLAKLSHLAVRYSVRALLAGDEKTARRYFHLAAAIDPAVMDDPAWKGIEAYWEAEPERRADLVARFRQTENLVTRSVSYEPPSGSVPLEEEEPASSAAPPAEAHGGAPVAAGLWEERGSTPAHARSEA